MSYMRCRTSTVELSLKQLMIDYGMPLEWLLSNEIWKNRWRRQESFVPNHPATHFHVTVMFCLEI